jgi:hypothetical protein
MTANTIEKTPPPQWVLDFWEGIDSKIFGESFDLLTEDAQLQLGVGHWQGCETIREMLRNSNLGVDTKHEVHEFWDAGLVKTVRGEMILTRQDTGKTARTTIGHFLYMDERDLSRVRRWIGSFGPVEFGE